MFVGRLVWSTLQSVVINGGMNIAVIPARGGSKRIPGKNRRLFCGRPMIAYSVLAAQQSEKFDRILVSTDDDEIAEIAIAAGAEVPFRRPGKLADDFTPTIPVIRHAVQWCEEHWGQVGYVCCIYATAPFIRVSDIREGLDRLMAQPECQFAFPVTTFPFPIFRAVKVTAGRVVMIWPEHEQTRSQDLPECFHDAGQFYWGTAEAWKTAKGIYSSVSAAIPIPRERVQDIDTEEDWMRAEFMYRAMHPNGSMNSLRTIV
jgi:pseudaminic acid cytidylyltransferase